MPDVTYRADEWDHWRALWPEDMYEPKDSLERWQFHTCLALRNKLNGYEHTRPNRVRVAWHIVQADNARRDFLGGL